MDEQVVSNVDPAIYKEIDRINEEHCKHCPCMKEEIEEQAKFLAIEGAKDIKENPLLRESVSASLDVLVRNEQKAIEVIANKHRGEPCSLQSQYALGLWQDFEKKYNIENPEVRILVGRIIVMALRAYKMSGDEMITTRYDKEGNTIVELYPTVNASRQFSETIAKVLQVLDEMEFGRKIIIKTDLPSRAQLFGSDKWILVDSEEDDKKV